MKTVLLGDFRWRSIRWDSWRQGSTDLSKPSTASELPGQLEEEMVCFKGPSEKAQRGMMKDNITTQPRLKQAEKAALLHRSLR